MSKMDAIKRRQKLVNKSDSKPTTASANKNKSSSNKASNKSTAKKTSGVGYAVNSSISTLNKSPLLDAVQKKSDRDMAKAKAQGNKKAAYAQAKYNNAKDRRSKAAYRQEIMDAKYPLSAADSNLSTKNKQAIQEAKAKWDKGKKLKEAGQTAYGQLLQDNAHFVAENRRNEAGYSGGESGNQYFQPRLSGNDRLLTDDAKRRLRSYKLAYEYGQETGNQSMMESAENAAEYLRAQKDSWAKNPTREDAHGRSIEIPVGEMAIAQRSFFPAIGKGVAGAFDALLKAGNAATRDTIYNSRDNTVQSQRQNERTFKEEAAKAGSEEERKSLLDRAEESGEAAKAAKRSSVAEPSKLLEESQKLAANVVNASDNPLYRVASQGALSMGQMAPALALNLIPGVGQVASLGAMGAMAAGSKAGELAQEGVGSQEALARGAVSGIIESITEKIPLGKLKNIIKGDTGKTILRSTLEQMGTEATEESVSYLANYVADKAAKDPNAEFSLSELANNALVGAASGGVMGGGANLLSGNFGKNYLLEAARQGRNAEVNAKNNAEVNTHKGNGLVPLTEQEVVNLSSGKRNKIISTFDDAVKFVKNALANRNSTDRAYMGKVPESTAQRVLSDTGLDVFDYNVILPGDNVRHIIKHHGDPSVEDPRGQRAVTEDDIALIPQVIASPDSVRLSEKKDQQGRQVVFFEKEIDGNFVTVQAVNDKRHALQTDTLYITKKKNPQDTVHNSGDTPAPALYAQDAPPQDSSNIIVPNTNGSVNNVRATANDINAVNAILRGDIIQNGTNLPEGMGAMSSGGVGAFANWQANADTFHPVNEESAAVLAEEQGRAATEVPVTDPFGGLTSKTASTMANSGITPNGFIRELEQGLAEGRFSRMAYSDNRAVARAEQTIRDLGFQGAVTSWLADAKAGKLSKDNTALGITLYNNAVNAGDAKLALDLASAMVTYGKTAGQTLQAFNLINKMTPSGQLYAISKTVEGLNEQARKRSKLDKETGLPVFEDIEIDPVLAQQFMEAQTDEERLAIEKEIYRDVGTKMPPTWYDKFNAWRYWAMLANPRTHIRNFVGNAVFMPVRGAKSAIAAGIETAFLKEGRTKALLNHFGAEDRARLSAGYADFSNVEDIIKNGGKYDNTWSVIDDNRTIFQFKPMEKMRKKNEDWLDKGDMIFSKPAYAGALAQYLKANGISGSDFSNGTISEAQKTAAQEYAIKEAQKATYRDLNAFSEWVTSAGKLRDSESKVERAAGYLVEGVLPFKKTPANILVRGVEYSPIGLIRGFKQVAVDVRNPNSGVTAAEAIDNIASGLTGTGLFGFGILCALKGLVSGGGTGDDKQDGFNDLQGYQDYALNLGDYSYTIDWMAPEAPPFFMGVELYNNVVNRGGANFATFSDFTDALGRLADPLLDMSMLSGLNDMIESVKFADSGIMAVVANAGLSYLGQYVPTFFGQLERTFETERQTTYVDRESGVPAGIQRFLGKTANKIPGVEYNQIPYVDAWGRKESTGGKEPKDYLIRAAQNMLSPGYLSKINTTDADKELQRLNDAGFEGMFPTRSETSTKINGKYLTGDQYLAMQTTKGGEAKRVLDALIGSELYKSMTDEQRAKTVDRVYDYANAKAKVKVGADADDTYSGWMKKAQVAKDEAGISETDFVAVNAMKSVLDDEIDENDDEAKAGFRQGKWEEFVDGMQQFSNEQKQYIKENIKFWQVIPASSSAYNKAVNAGWEGDDEIQRVMNMKKEADTDGNGHYKKSEVREAARKAANGDNTLYWMYYNAWKDSDWN